MIIDLLYLLRRECQDIWQEFNETFKREGL